MSDTAPRPLPGRLADAVKAGLSKGVGAIVHLLRSILPATFAAALLAWSGALAAVAGLLAPPLDFLGLPGEAVIVLLSSIFINLYAAIAVASSLGLDLRTLTILAVMCLTAHNLIAETASIHRTGSSPAKMVALRILGALLLGWASSLLLPRDPGTALIPAAGSLSRPDFAGMLVAWFLATARLSLLFSLLVLGISILQGILEEFRAVDFLSRAIAPLMRLFGLPESASFLWVVVNVVGYAQGTGIVASQIEQGRIKPREGDLFNHHAGVCHSLLEDTLLYAAVGIPLLWLTVPRLLAAALVVWAERLRRHFFRRSFRAGTSA